MSSGLNVPRTSVVILHDHDNKHHILRRYATLLCAHTAADNHYTAAGIETDETHSAETSSVPSTGRVRGSKWPRSCATGAPSGAFRDVIIRVDKLGTHATRACLANSTVIFTPRCPSPGSNQRKKRTGPQGRCACILNDTSDRLALGIEKATRRRQSPPSRRRLSAADTRLRFWRR